ncbi:type II toxin-antitoxin system PemK/MazF family toxin [Coleofasciculus sp. H7-2]|uniref:type II toxin-antitoxin system PemK/MazF family toxin n=1 Tax=Coleofasciculus sp. H7-2 TaxID=3351545 RepID=UPI00366EC4A3
MTIDSLQTGDVVTANFPRHQPRGHEQEGYRPAIVVGFPYQIGVPRFSSVIVIPMTTDRGQTWAIASPDLYPRFPAGIAGLKKPSIVLLDQVRVLDVNRIVEYRGCLKPTEYTPILAVIQRMITP